MANTSTNLAACALVLSLAISAVVPAAAQPATVDFGDDSGEYPYDGQCEDPRFTGRGMSNYLLTDDIGRDASDCREALNAGQISLNPLFAKPASPAAIIFGDDVSRNALDDECDDIRFVGPHSADAIYLFEDVGHDASDCRAGIEAGTLRWQGHLAQPERGQIF